MYNIPLDDFNSTSALSFYEEHKHISLSKLLLKYSKDPLKQNLSLQLESRRRAVGKLPSWLSIDGIVFPPKFNLEQASSETTAEYKASLVKFDTSLDLTAGTGVDSWQLARQAKKHVLVEENEDLLALTKHNFKKLDFHNLSFFAGSAETFLEQNTDFFDLIYIDPSRRKEDGSKAIALNDYSPNVIEMQNDLLKRCKNLLVKVAPFADITYLISCFPKYLKEVHVVAVANECKEILLLLAQNETKNPEIKTINFSSTKTETFSFLSMDENCKAEIANAIDAYLYEPNAAILKSGAFNTIALAYKLKKLHVNSHLYTSDSLVKGFPGRIFHVKEVAAAYKLKEKYQKVSIATRNFPDKPEFIRKRLKLTDGNDYRLFATTLGKNKVFVVGVEVPNNQYALQDK